MSFPNLADVADSLLEFLDESPPLIEADENDVAAELHSAPRSQIEKYKTDFETLTGHALTGSSEELVDAAAFNEACSGLRKALKVARRGNRSPIAAIKAHIKAAFSDSLTNASYLANVFFHAIDDDNFVTAMDLEVYKCFIPWSDAKAAWKSCNFVTMFLLALASSKKNAKDALKFRSKSRGGMPDLRLIRTTPSTSFRAAYVKARSEAQGHGKTTIISVSMADVHMFELCAFNPFMGSGYCSFAHTFVVAVGPEGFVVWQSWGGHGYRLDEWIARGGDRVRSWDEAEEFTKDFTRLTVNTSRHKSSIDGKRNKLYKKLFDIDLHSVTGSKGPESRPLVPKFEAWVQLHVLEDVKINDVLKFRVQ